MIQVRSTGCGRVLGLGLVLVGVIVLLVHYHVVPTKVGRWWPVIIIALGVALLVRHYWQLLSRRRPAAIVDPSSPFPVFPRPRSYAPPGFALVVIAVGIYLLLDSLHYVTLGVALAILFILLGAAVLSGSVRASLRRR